MLWRNSFLRPGPTSSTATVAPRCAGLSMRFLWPSRCFRLGFDLIYFFAHACRDFVRGRARELQSEPKENLDGFLVPSASIAEKRRQVA